MTGHRSWSAQRKAELADPEVAREAAAVRAELEHFEANYHRTLSQLRRAREMTQKQLAAVLGVSQAQVSRVENQADLYLSTLRSYVEAMGGELQLRAFFPGGQAALVAVDEALGSLPDQEPVGPTQAGRAGAPADVRALFSVVILHAGQFEAAEERFRAALAA